MFFKYISREIMCFKLKYFHRWRCEEGLDDLEARWHPQGRPDLSDCKSEAVSDLEAAARREEADPEDAAVSRLVHLAAAVDGVRGESTLYGGDLPAAVAILEAAANRLEYRLQSRSAAAAGRSSPGGGGAVASLVRRVAQEALRASSALLSAASAPVWGDLPSAAREGAARALRAAVERHGAILARVVADADAEGEEGREVELQERTREIGERRGDNDFACLTRKKGEVRLTCTDGRKGKRRGETKGGDGSVQGKKIGPSHVNLNWPPPLLPFFPWQ